MSKLAKAVDLTEKRPRQLALANIVAKITKLHTAYECSLKSGSRGNSPHEKAEELADALAAAFREAHALSCIHHAEENSA